MTAEAPTNSEHAQLRRLSASLVLFHNPPEEFEVAISSFLNGSPDGYLVVVDNSAAPLQSRYFQNDRVEYIFAGENLGFGKAHNRALQTLKLGRDLHLLLNPDVGFGPEVLPHLLDVAHGDPSIGALMPRVISRDGSLQRLSKLLPTPMTLICRRFLPQSKLKTRIDRRYELHSLPQDRVSDVPTLSGCFMLVRQDILRKIGGFDERFFMYMEDVDLVRRVGMLARIVYVPQVSVSHGYAKGSYKHRRLFYYHLKSAFKYFYKWGWWRDAYRDAVNARMLSRIR